MKKALKIIAVVAVLVLAGIQFVRPERVNPPVDKANTLEAVATVPPDIESTFKRSCDDCHSNETRWPWYSNVAPVSWSVADHVEEGRRHLNFSVWSTYSEKKKNRKLGEICEQVKDHEMPHPQYLWIHWDAALSDKQINAICKWTESARSSKAE